MVPILRCGIGVSLRVGFLVPWWHHCLDVFVQSEQKFLHNFGILLGNIGPSHMDLGSRRTDTASGLDRSHWNGYPCQRWQLTKFGEGFAFGRPEAGPDAPSDPDGTWWLGAEHPAQNEGRSEIQELSRTHGSISQFTVGTGDMVGSQLTTFVSARNLLFRSIPAIIGSRRSTAVHKLHVLYSYGTARLSWIDVVHEFCTCWGSVVW